MSVDCLEWSFGLTRREFIAKAEALSRTKSTKGREIQFTLDRFLKQYALMTEKDTHTVLQALRKVRFTHLSLGQYLPFETREPYQPFDLVRMRKLFMKLGWKRTLIKGSFSYDYVDPSSLGQCISSLRYMKKLSVSSWHEFDCYNLAVDLTSHPSLQEVTIRLPTSTYFSVLPILGTICTLTTVKLMQPTMIAAGDAVAMEVITNLLRTKSPVKIILTDLALETSNAISSKATMNKVELNGCKVSDAGSLANLFTGSLVKNICIRNPVFDFGGSNQFYVGLAEGLASMPCLEKLDYKMSCDEALDLACSDESVVAVIRAAAKCPKLTEFRLGLALAFQKQSTKHSLPNASGLVRISRQLSFAATISRINTATHHLRRSSFQPC